MAGEWPIVLVTDLYEIGSGLSKPRSEFGFGTPFVTFKDVLDNYFIPSTPGSLVNATEKERHACSVKRGDVFLTRTSETQGELGMSSVALKDFESATFNGFTKRLRPKAGTELVPEYVGYYFRGPKFRQAVTAMSSLSTRASLNNEMIGRLSITLPPFEIQRQIGQILKALDDKIELNRRMNVTLEALAWALFQSWFVDFDPVRAKLDGRLVSPLPVKEGQGVGYPLDPAIAPLFPNSFQDSPLGPIPHGWRAAHLEEIASVGSGKRPESRCDVLSPECNIPLYGGGGRMGYVPSALYDKPILFTGRVGTLGLIFRTAEPSWPSDNTLIVEPQAGNFDFTYFVLKGFDLITLNRGSTQPLLTQTDLKRQTFVLPTKDVVKAFADVSEPIFRQMVSNERESRTLATLRDTLLPKLLSGELSVPHTEQIIGRTI